MAKVNYPHTKKCASRFFNEDGCNCDRRLLPKDYEKDRALDIASCGFDVDVMPTGYYLRIHLEDQYYPCYDWYFTKTGTLCVVRSEDTPPKSLGRFDTLESVVEFINKHEEEFNS